LGVGEGRFHLPGPSTTEDETMAKKKKKAK
jgi:hypothetical protein